MIAICLRNLKIQKYGNSALYLITHIIACWRFGDKRDGQNTLVIATHGFIKKTQKTPQREILHAISIKDIYFNQK